MKGEQRVLESKIQALADSITALQRKQSGSSLAQRRLDDNLKLRKFQAKLLLLEQEGQRVQLQLATLDITSVRARHDALKLRHERLIHERAGLLGETKILQDQVTRLTAELREDYKNVQEDYTESWVKLKTGEMACKDLNTFAKALDSAIMT